MLLTVDVGNTNTVFGVYKGEELVFESRINTDPARMGDQYAIIFSDIFDMYKVKTTVIDGAIIASVVQPVTNHIITAIKRLFGVNALVIGPGIKSGLNIRIDNPVEIGADLVCAAVAAKALYPNPCIAVDLGTVTKVMAIDKDGALRGGALCAGVNGSFRSIADTTAALPLVGAGSINKVIGTNTPDCIKIGVLFGIACMIDGLTERFEEELRDAGQGENCCIVMTGGFSEVIAPYCRSNVIVNVNLVSQGLRMIYDKNKT